MQTESPEVEVHSVRKERCRRITRAVQLEEHAPGAEGRAEVAVGPSDHSVEVSLRDAEHAGLLDSLVPALAAPREGPAVREELPLRVIVRERDSSQLDARAIAGACVARQEVPARDVLTDIGGRLGRAHGPILP
jgi:hypothetical protein